MLCSSHTHITTYYKPVISRIWSFPKSWGYPQFSSILVWDFPWNKPSSVFGVPPFMETPWTPHIYPSYQWNTWEPFLHHGTRALGFSSLSHVWCHQYPIETCQPWINKPQTAVEFGGIPFMCHIKWLFRTPRIFLNHGLFIRSWHYPRSKHPMIKHDQNMISQTFVWHLHLLLQETNTMDKDVDHAQCKIEKHTTHIILIGGFKHFDYFPSYMGCHPNPIDEVIFFKMVKTTNQIK